MRCSPSRQLGPRSAAQTGHMPDNDGPSSTVQLTTRMDAKEGHSNLCRNRSPSKQLRGRAQLHVAMLTKDTEHRQWHGMHLVAQFLDCSVDSLQGMRGACTDNSGLTDSQTSKTHPQQPLLSHVWVYTTKLPDRHSWLLLKTSGLLLLQCQHPYLQIMWHTASTHIGKP